jgi:predicted nuclease with TOPRIM domain
MPTNNELENQVQQLEERLGRVQASNSRLRDDISILKSNYDTLVEGLNARFEDIRSSFLGQR